MLDMGILDYLIVLLSILVVIFFVFSAVAAWRESKAASKRAKEDIIDTFLNESGHIDILKTMRLNMLQMREYYDMSISHARSSYRLAIISLMLGMALFSAAFVLAFKQDTQLVTVLLPAVGGAITELFAAASLSVYAKALTQTNRYYRTLNENERFLSAISVAQMTDKDRQESMLMAIIGKRMESLDKATPLEG